MRGTGSRDDSHQGLLMLLHQHLQYSSSTSWALLHEGILRLCAGRCSAPRCALAGGRLRFGCEPHSADANRAICCPWIRWRTWTWEAQTRVFTRFLCLQDKVSRSYLGALGETYSWRVDGCQATAAWLGIQEGTIGKSGRNGASVLSSSLTSAFRRQKPKCMLHLAVIVARENGSSSTVRLLPTAGQNGAVHRGRDHVQRSVACSTGTFALSVWLWRQVFQCPLDAAPVACLVRARLGSAPQWHLQRGRSGCHERTPKLATASCRGCCRFQKTFLCKTC